MGNSSPFKKGNIRADAANSKVRKKKKTENIRPNIVKLKN
jgi:hypothetical protein